MQVRYRNDLYGNYMLVEIPEYIDTGQYTFHMLTKNRIPGVLYARERMEDGKSYLYYDISRKRSLSEEYENKQMQLEDMILLFQKITFSLEEIKNYLFRENMVILEPQYIFKDLENDDLYVLILPWEGERNTLHKLAEFFLEKVNHRDENGVNAAYLFYRQQSQPQFCLSQFNSILEKESILKRQKNKNSTEYMEKFPNTYVESEEYEKDSKDREILHWNVEESKKEKEKNVKGIKLVCLVLSGIFLVLSILPMIASILKMSCIAASILLFVVFLIMFSGGNKEKVLEKNEIFPEMEIDTSETVFFDTYESEEVLKLQWKERGREKQFILKEFPCIAGKMKDEVSLVISDISVSRVHCKFIKKDNKVCILDLNSTNGTFLNGLPLKNGETQEIEKNDEILIGNVAVNVV